MILTDGEIKEIRQCIEIQAGLDEELFKRCGQLMHLGAFDEAIRSAFVLLEERLRKIVAKPEMTGTNLANFAFGSKDGSLAKALKSTASEQEGLRELYSGAFKLFRNPVAHGAVRYDGTYGKSIIGLVNLLLRILKNVEELPPSELFAQNLEKLLRSAESEIGVTAANRFRLFLGKCIKMGLKPSIVAKKWIPFKKYTLCKYEKREKPKPHNIALFYFIGDASIHKLSFPTDYYYGKVVSFDLSGLLNKLKKLGFQPEGKNQEPRIGLKTHNDQAFFEDLFNIITWISNELDKNLIY